MFEKSIYLTVIAALLLMTGCTKTVQEEQEAGAFIRLDMSVPESRTLVSQDNMRSQTIMLYDVHNRTGGANAAAVPELEQYLDAQEVVYDDGWRFVSRDQADAYVDIPWTKRGTHNFLAYNLKDGDTEVPVTVTYSNHGLVAETEQSLLVGSQTDQWTLGPDTQFDFMYAWAARDVAVQGYVPVSLGFRHAFAAVTFEIKNISSERKTVKDFYLTGLKDKGYMTLRYGSVQAEYVISSDDASSPQFQVSDDHALEPGESLVVLRGLGRIGDDGTMLVWPHVNADFRSVNLSITYRGPGRWDRDETEVLELYSQFGVKNWAAGYRYNYLISIADDKVVMDVVKVVDWLTDEIILED